MQDRTSANSMKVLLQRAAGPYIWVNSVGSNQAAASSDVCFAPKADNQADISLCPLGAKSGLMQRHKIRAYSIISSARIISDSGMSIPSSTSAGIRAISRPEL